MIVECPGCRSRYDVTGRPAGTQARCRCGTVFALPKPPEWAAAMSCPNCAAMCPPDKDQCAFCGTVLMVVSCPRCFGKAFVGTKHCQHCGAPVTEGARDLDAASQRACPRCSVVHHEKTQLVAHLVGDTLLDHCPKCDGMWVDVDALEKIVADRDHQTAMMAVGIPPSRGPVLQETTVNYLHCPDCDKVMTRANFGKRSGVIVDVCRIHGTWFDRDELRAVVDFVMKGGLAASHQRDLEEIRREVREKEQHIRQLGATAMSGSGAMMDATDLRHTWWKVSLIGEALTALIRLFER